METFKHIIETLKLEESQELSPGLTERKNSLTDDEIDDIHQALDNLLNGCRNSKMEAAIEEVLDLMDICQ